MLDAEFIRLGCVKFFNILITIRSFFFFQSTVKEKLAISDIKYKWTFFYSYLITLEDILSFSLKKLIANFYKIIIESMINQA